MRLCPTITAQRCFKSRLRSRRTQGAPRRGAPFSLPVSADATVKKIARGAQLCSRRAGFHHRQAVRWSIATALCQSTSVQASVPCAHAPGDGPISSLPGLFRILLCPSVWARMLPECVSDNGFALAEHRHASEQALCSRWRSSPGELTPVCAQHKSRKARRKRRTPCTPHSIGSLAD